MTRSLVEIIQDDQLDLAAKKLELSSTISSLANPLSEVDIARALKHTAINGQNELLAHLIAEDVDIDATEGDRWTALLTLAGDTVSTHAWNVETVSILLEGDPNSKLHTGKPPRTALHWAAFNGHDAVVAKLLEYNSKANEDEFKSDALDRWSSPAASPIHLAAQNGHANIVQLLLSYGVDIDVVSSLSSTPLHLAAKNGHSEVVNVLLGANPSADVNARQADGATPLHLAAEEGHVAVAKILLSQPGVEHNPYDKQHWSPLLKARFRAKAPMVDLLTSRMFKGWKNLARFVACKVFRAFVVGFYGPGDDSSGTETPISLNSLLSVAKSPSGRSLWKRGLTSKGEDSPVYRWVHLPANNLVWVEKLLMKILLDSGSEDYKYYRQMFATFFEQQRSTKRHSKHMKTFCRLDSEAMTVHADGTITPEKLYGAFFMPYLSFQSAKGQQNMVKLIEEAVHRPDPDLNQPIFQNDANFEKLEALIRGYDIRSPNLHLPRTLDQFRHPAMSTVKRDSDQVVYRWQTLKENEKFYSVPRIYMVSQLWVWILPEAVITCFPDLENTEGAFDTILHDVKFHDRAVDDQKDLLMAITEHFTGLFDRHHPPKSDKRLFEMFEAAIGHLTHATGDLLEEFQRDIKQISFWLTQGSSDKRPSKVNTPAYVDRLIDISRESKYFFECVDMEEELISLDMVLEEQTKALSLLWSSVDNALDTRRRETNIDHRIALQQDRAEIARLGRQVADVKQILNQLLDLKPRHATAIEARFARDQAEDTARSGQIIMVFTVVTILFLPLSFMAAFFAINIDAFPQDADGHLPLGWVSKYLFSISMAISVPIIVFAWIFADMQKWTKGFSIRKAKDTQETRSLKEVPTAEPITAIRGLRDRFSRKGAGQSSGLTNGTSEKVDV